MINVSGAKGGSSCEFLDVEDDEMIEWVVRYFRWDDSLICESSWESWWNLSWMGRCSESMIECSSFVGLFRIEGVIKGDKRGAWLSKLGGWN
jgi:hypothetical protein